MVIDVARFTKTKIELGTLRLLVLIVDSRRQLKASSLNQSILYCPAFSMKGNSKRAKVRTKRELAVEVWNRLRRPSVGERELRAIQSAIAKQFGKGTVDSPASIARLLADEGAELRHPEVIEFDARWREKQIESDELSGHDEVVGARPLTLGQVEALIRKFERLRRKLEQTGDHPNLRRLRDRAITARQEAQSFTKDRKLEAKQRLEQTEIIEWLAVWIQTPNLFDEWLDLRRRSPDFRKKFSTETSS